MSPDRVVIGTDRKGRGADLMEELYAPFSRMSHRVMIVDRRSSEVIKYASNAMLALRISFMNEISGLCESTGADIETVRFGMGADRRIGPSFLYSGVGYGGSCFPKDVKALKNTCGEFGCPSDILSAVEHVNERQKGWPLRVLERHWKGQFEGKRIALWGIAYKPNTDDIREAPSIVVIKGLLEKGASIIAHDPAAVANLQKVIASDRLAYSEHHYDAIGGADALVLMTEWGSYRTPDFARMKSQMREPVILDGRNQYNPAMLTEIGFIYYGVGRGQAHRPRG
jgi:UDPglucose 6-dehydrogenase